MANYSLVANSVFQPFTYQELAAPLDRQDAYHEKLMEEYDKLSSQADVLEAMGANDRDNKSKTYGQYKAYSDALRSEAENLYRHGLNSESRMRLTDLRRRYNTEIVPIQNAWNKREEEAKMQQTASMSNPSLMFTRDARSTSLDEYIANPTGGFGVINRAAITAQMAGMAKNLAKKISQSGGKNIGIDQYTYEHISEHGLDPNFINDWIQNPEKSPTLTNMMNQVLAANGVTVDALKGSPNAAAITSAATGAAQMGAWEAIGEDKAQIIENFGTREGLKHAHAVDMENRNFAHQVALKQTPSYSDLHPTSDTPGGGMSLFDRQPGELPIAVADGNIEDAVNKSASAFGWSNDKKTTTGYRLSHSITVAPKKIKGAPGSPLAYIPEFKVDLFDKSGNVRSYKDYMSDVQKKVTALRTQNGQRLSKADMQKVVNQAASQFSNAYKTATSIGLNPQQGYKMEDVVRALDTQKASGAAGYVKGYNWNHAAGDWNSMTQKMNVKEIKSVDHNGKFSYKTDNVALGDVIGSENINPNKRDPHAFVTTLDGQEGIVFTVGGRQFFADAKTIGRSSWGGGQAFYWFKKAAESTKAAEAAANSGNMKEAYTAQQEAEGYANTAFSMLESSLVLSTSKSKQDMLYQRNPSQWGKYE